MKKIVWVLIVVMCLGLFVACGSSESAQERGDRLLKMTDADWAKASDADKKDAAAVFVNTIKAAGFQTTDLTLDQVGQMLDNAPGKSLNDLIANSVNGQQSGQTETEDTGEEENE